ncbi:MAG: SOS response-associated peptidase [Solirubrobacterales bacterium]|nr:SOS response-associated peptidase [Solirubrobacterales bacterium]
MCGRFTMTSSDQRRLGNRFQISIDDQQADALGRYNIAPTQEILTVTDDPEGDGGRRATLSRWGLVPVWAKDLKAGYKMINARSDRVLKSRAYGPLIKKGRHRCLIMGDGFFEWMKAENPKSPRQPMHFTVDGGEPFAFAGLTTTREWEGEQLTSCTMMTTSANEVVEPVHDRMPVILPNPEAEAAWLSGDLDPEEAVSLCVPLEPGRLSAKPANPALNKVGGTKEGPDLLEA